VKPAPFTYLAPRTVDDALAALSADGEDAKLLAGGQSLVPLMNFRFAAPRVLVDINRIADLDRIAVNDDVSIGATARQLTVERSAAVRRAAPLLVEALRYVGYVATRSRGTVCGSIAHADPAAELPAVLLALNGAVVVRGPRGERTIAAGDLFQSVYTTSVAPDEMIVSVRFPIAAGGVAIEEVARRHGDFAIAGSVAHVISSPSGEISRARIALFGVGSGPVHGEAGERLLVGARIDDMAAFAEAAEAVVAGVNPPDDIQVPAAYRRRVAAAVTRRALARAATRSTLDGRL
jgi:aerobic carbon-monoxide dehydrogenase medium subunit